MSQHLARHTAAHPIPVQLKDGRMGWPEIAVGPYHTTMHEVKKWERRGEVMDVRRFGTREYGRKLAVAYVRLKPYHSPFRQALPWVGAAVVAAAGLTAFAGYVLMAMVSAALSFGLSGFLGVLGVVGVARALLRGCGRLHIVRCE